MFPKRLDVELHEEQVFTATPSNSQQITGWIATRVGRLGWLDGEDLDRLARVLADTLESACIEAPGQRLSVRISASYPDVEVHLSLPAPRENPEVPDARLVLFRRASRPPMTMPGMAVG